MLAAEEAGTGPGKLENLTYFRGEKQRMHLFINKLTSSYIRQNASQHGFHLLLRRLPSYETVTNVQRYRAMGSTSGQFIIEIH